MRHVFQIALTLQILFVSFSWSAEPRRQQEDDDWPCTKPGLMCSTCSKISQCEQNEDGTWTQTALERCELGQTCLDSNATCTKDYNPQCESRADLYCFQCHQVGMFPDPFDCRYFHICPFENGASMKFRCPNSYFYDPVTTRCVIKASKEKCPPPVAPCRQTSQGPILANSRIYHMCLPVAKDRYYLPHLYYCRDNYKYIDGACVDPDQAHGLVDGKCENIGVFYHPDCMKYYTCKVAGEVPEETVCPQNNYFNVFAKICMPVNCNRF